LTGLQGIPSAAWLDCFPEHEIDGVLDYVISSWSELVRRFPNAHHDGELEPTLTKSLSMHLEDPKRRRQAAMGGRFNCERGVPKRRRGYVKHIGRTDITYDYPWSGEATLTLEFKKLKGTASWRSAYRNFGMARFINGPYAENQPHGVMFGMVTVDVAAEANAIRASITRCHLRLACVRDAAGGMVSAVLAMPPDAHRFNTRHRKRNGADLHLRHVLIPLPVAR
jgi:hypothetical protein